MRAHREKAYKARDKLRRFKAEYVLPFLTSPIGSGVTLTIRACIYSDRGRHISCTGNV